MKGFLESKNIRKMRIAQAFERVSVQDLKMHCVEHLDVSDVDCDPENRSRMAQVAKSEM